MKASATRAAIQLLFVERRDDEVVVDGILLTLDEADVEYPGTPVTVRLRLPRTSDWQQWLHDMLRAWADEGRSVEVHVRRRHQLLVMDLVSGDTRMSLDLIESE